MTDPAPTQIVALPPAPTPAMAFYQIPTIALSPAAAPTPNPSPTLAHLPAPIPMHVSGPSPTQGPVPPVLVTLVNANQWSTTYPYTEMKSTDFGTLVNPQLKLKFSGLPASSVYYVGISLNRADEWRYLFKKNVQEWSKCKSTHQVGLGLIVFHPNGARSGKYLNNHTTTFKQLGISYSAEKCLPGGNMIHTLTSHKYMPIVNIIEASFTKPPLCFPLKMASFIAILNYKAKDTRYQKELTRYRPSAHGDSSNFERNPIPLPRTPYHYLTAPPGALPEYTFFFGALLRNKALPFPGSVGHSPELSNQPAHPSPTAPEQVPPPAENKDQPGPSSSNSDNSAPLLSSAKEPSFTFWRPVSFTDLMEVANHNNVNILEDNNDDDDEDEEIDILN